MRRCSVVTKTTTDHTTMPSWTMFALAGNPDKHPLFEHIHPIPQATGMCRGSPAEEVIPVTVTADDSGPYWGWMGSGEDSPSMIQVHEVLLDICFPYGMKSAINVGQGKPIRLTVTGKDDKVDHPAWEAWTKSR